MSSEQKINLRDNFWLFLARAVDILAPVILIPIFIELYGQDEYGKYIFHSSVVLFLAFIGNFGSENSGPYLYSKFAGSTKVMSYIMIIKTTIILTSVFLLYLVLTYINVDVSFYSYFWYILVIEALLPREYFIYHGNFREFFLIKLLLKLVPLLYLYFDGSNIALEEYLGILNFYTLTFCLTYLTFFSKLSFKSLDLSELKACVAFISKYFIYYILGKYRLLIGKFVVGSAIGYSELGIYDIMDKIKSLSTVPGNVITDTVHSRALRGGKLSIRKVIMSSSLISLLTFIVGYRFALTFNVLTFNVSFKIIALFLFLALGITLNTFIIKNIFILNNMNKELFKYAIISSITLSILLLLIYLLQIQNMFYVLLSVSTASFVSTLTLLYYGKNSLSFKKKHS